MDCDGDGILDQVCYDTRGYVGVIQSSRSCVFTWPYESCTAAPFFYSEPICICESTDDTFPNLCRTDGEKFRGSNWCFVATDNGCRTVQNLRAGNRRMSPDPCKCADEPGVIYGRTCKSWGAFASDKNREK